MKKLFTLFAAVLMAGSMMALEATLLTPGVPTTTYEDEYYYFVTTGAGQVTFTVDATGDMEYDLYNEAGQYQGVDIILSMLNNHTYVWNCPAAGTYYWQHFSSGSTNLTITGSIFDAPAINYWLVGGAAENGWDQTAATPMPGDSIVRHLAAGTYEFKVLTTEGSWTGALGYANLNVEASSANVFGDDNVAFELENEGDVTIKVVEGQIVVLGTFKEQVEADYYIKFAGNNWTWVGMTQAPSGYYMYEGVWGGVGANVNTSMSDNGASWFPEADIMFLDESMEEMPVPAVGTEGIYIYMQYTEPVLAFLYEGTPTGLQNVKAVKAVKVIKNGQVVILRDGKRFNLVGAEL